MKNDGLESRNAHVTNEVDLLKYFKINNIIM